MTNKVLFISNYKNLSGYSNAARSLILCMDAAGIDVVPRNINLTNTFSEVPERILELEQKESRGCNINIQFTLPHFFEYDGNFDKSILMFCWETSHFRNIPLWTEKINTASECWVPCNDMVKICRDSGVEIPIRVVPIPCDPSKYFNYYPKFEIPELKDCFTFYFIGEINQRKNLDGALTAFHLEFEPHEKVQFVIKGNKPELSPAQTTRYIQELIKSVKQDLKLYPNINDYKEEIVISEELDDNGIMRLHSTCDCLLSPHKGESWSLPVFDSMCMGKTPVATNVGGPKDYLTGEDGPCGYLLDGFPEPVIGMESDFYTANQNWWGTDINQLRRCMRMAYENVEQRKTIGGRGIDRSVDFSHEKIGNIIKEVLNG